jgi:hypothetical protein
VVLWCVAKGHLSAKDGRAVLGRLKESSLWVSNGVMREALAALMELEGRK